MYKTEYAWQEESSRFLSQFRALLNRYPGDPGLGPLAALRIVRPILPRIRTRNALFRATAWHPVKMIGGGSRVAYVGRRALLAWARQQAQHG